MTDTEAHYRRMIGPMLSDDQAATLVARVHARAEVAILRAATAERQLVELTEQHRELDQRLANLARAVTAGRVSQARTLAYRYLKETTR